MAGRLSAEQILDMMYETCRIPGAFEGWAGYRERLTDYLINATEPGSSFAIIGAGESNDIDLARLRGHAGSLALFDIDTESLKRAEERYGTDDSVRICPCDLFGAAREDYLGLIKVWVRAFVNRKATGETVSEYLDKMKALYGRVNSREIIIGRDAEKSGEETEGTVREAKETVGETDSGNIPDKYDNVVMIGVHSQLASFVTRIWECCAQTLYAASGSRRAVLPGERAIFTEAGAENAILIPRVNDAVISVTGKRLFAGLEECVEERPEAGAVEGAYQAFLDFQKRIEHGELSCKAYYTDVWPFAEGTSYRMKILKLDVK